MTSSVILEVTGVQGGYGEGLVLHGVDLSVKAGELLVLIGPNGHGKSTLVKTISGLLTPSAGTIDFYDKRISGLHTERIVELGLTQIPQGDLLFPSLKDRQMQRARTLSGGERRMVALGRGLMSDAKMLMIDEPSLGLAPVLVIEVYAQIAAIAAAGITVLLVEENVTHVREIADRLLLMESGRIVMAGTPAEVLADSSVMRTYLGIVD